MSSLLLFLQLSKRRNLSPALGYVEEPEADTVFPEVCLELYTLAELHLRLGGWDSQNLAPLGTCEHCVRCGNKASNAFPNF